ncbi:venom acid phosphatase Acph-1-like [Trichogramma pretiosum]|uniref:venom acid phosphatase Acph-1-like n=1 Tax=Trichogramma pretiosum TaxID=7493 RepID=UPI0006C9929D|nr:venom acid phosphatase Acph-1-like [Trichogramma pretiosum]
MECKSNLSLELVQVLFRHGDRTPNEMEASIDDSDKHLYEPYGYAQLTPNGMRTVYKLGQMLRKRYNSFLQDYKPEHVWAFSSNTDRAKTSLDLVLAGLYPPTETSRWNDSLPWRPIPTHYSSEPRNYLMMPFSSIHFQKEIERVNSRPEVKKKWSKFERLIALLKDNTKLSFQNRLEILIVFGKIRNSLSMGGDLPRWMSPEALDELHEAAILAFQMMFHNDFLLRLNCGPMLKEIIARMSEHTEGRSQRKIVLHSAHDINVAGFLHAYELDGVAPLPEYGAAVIVKKFKNEAGERFVQLMYWTGVSEKLIPMKLPGCGSLCTVEHYAKVVEHLLPSEAEHLE